MKKTTKMAAVLLSVMLMLSMIAPMASAAEGYTQQSLDDNFTRLLLTDQAFAAGTARTFTVTIPADGNYAVFLQKAEKDSTNFVASFTNGTDTYSLCSGTSANSAYGYTYVRLGATSTEPSAAVTLTKGDWTLSITAATAITVSYIDIRSTVINVDGTKQGIYPSDFDSIRDAVGVANYVNNDMNKTSYPLISGYDYFGDYQNSNLASAFSYGRGIHIRHGKTATYKLNVAKAGAYIIKMNVSYYTSAAVTEDTEVPTIVTATGNSSATFAYTFAAGTKSGAKSGMLSKTYPVTLAAGMNEITLKPDSTTADMYLWSFTIEPGASYVADGFSRITLADGAFAAGTAREFDVEIKQDGDYAVFLQKAETANTNFIVTFTKDGETKTLWNSTSANSSYAYNYVRIGGEGGQTSVSVPLTKGTWTMSITAATAMTVSYIDVRTTTIPIDGSKQAIYPSDYHTTEVGAVNYINGQIYKEEYPRVSDYTYYADYTNSALADPFSYGRGIHVAAEDFVTYKLNVAEAGGYKIKINGKFRNSAAVTAGTTASAAVSIDGNDASAVTLVYDKDYTAGQKIEQGLEYIVTLAEGENTLTIAPAAASYYYITSLTVESYDPDKENAVVLAKDEVANYMKAARSAYVTDAYADYTSSVISSYVKSSSAYSDKPKPVSISWEDIGAESYTLLISETEDFSGDVKTFENITETSYDVYNLYVDTVYYWKVQAGEEESVVGQFYTDETARFINVEGVRNVRDLGGWNGLNQGWAYRGSELDLVEGHGLELTEAGRMVMHDDLGIKTDLDFRSTDLTESPIGSDVAFVNDYKIGNYTNAFSSSLYTGVMKTFADIDNYPIYFHCWGGADRTGTVAFLLEALCGATEEDLAIDFELTSFCAVFGTRPRYDTTSYKYASTVAKLKEYAGDTLQEKAENYALNTLGLTRAEVSNIQSILSGNAVVFENSISAAVGRKTRIPLKNLGGHTVSSVTVNGEAAEFSLSENILTVKATQAGEGVITFEDGNTLVFAAEETSSCDTQVLENGFIRLNMLDTDFIAGETYKFPVTIAEDGDYAVFLNKEGTESNNFKVAFEQGETVVSLTDGGSASSAYGYNYIRTNARAGEASGSAALTAGDWVVSITPAADAAVTYIDIRSTVLPVSGAPQAIYPSDFNAYTPDVGSSNHVNGQIGKSLAKVSGYTYIGDYANSSLAEPYAGDRQIHFNADRTVTYKLNVKQAGSYKISFNHYFYLADAASITEDTDATLTITAGDNEAVTKTHTYEAGGTSTKTKATNEAMEVTLSAGVQTLTFASSVAGSYLCHLTIEKSAENLSDKVVSVDNTLTRIETDSENQTIASGASRGFDFTVPADGSYNFYAHIGSEKMDMEVALKNLDTQELTTIFDGTLSVINPVKLRRLGMGNTAPVALTANTNYRLYVTPSVDIAVPFIDVMNVNLPISGKTAVSPQYYSATNITDAQINCGDQSNKVTPESGYALAGNFLSSSLAAQSGFSTGYAVTPHISNSRSFTYTLNVTKAGVYRIDVDAGTYAGTYTDSEILEFMVDDVTETANYTRTDRGVERLTGPSVYLTEGTHTLKLNNPDGGNAGFYLHQILFTPVAGVGAQIDGSHASVSAYLDGSYTGVAMIALYSESNELIGLANAQLTDGDYVSASLTLSGTPVSAKVFIWGDLVNVAPLAENLEVTEEDAGWHVIA